MQNEMLLSELVATAHFVRARDKARKHAATHNCPIYIMRTRTGLVCDTAKPVMGEFWSVAPSGQVEHIAGPVI